MPQITTLSPVLAPDRIPAADSGDIITGPTPNVDINNNNKNDDNDNNIT